MVWPLHWLLPLASSVTAADVRAVAPELPADRLVSLGQVVRVGSTADFAAMIADQKNRVAAVVKAGGVTLDGGLARAAVDNSVSQR